MSPEFRSTVRKRFIWLASAGSLALLVASCEWFYSSEPRVAPGAGLSSAGHSHIPYISGGGIGRPASDPPGATSGGTLGRSTGTGTRGPGRGAVGSGKGGNGDGGGTGH